MMENTMPTAGAEQSSDLSHPQRAELVMASFGNMMKLREVAAATASIQQITNRAGFTEADGGRKALKRLRLAITRRAAEATEDAKAFIAAVKNQAKEMVAIVSHEEDRLAALTDEWSAKEERERAERERAERERLLAITTEINRIMNLPMTMLGRRTDEMRDAIASLSAIMVTPELFGAFTENALEAKIAALDKIANMLANQELVEEAARIKAAEDARRAEEEAKAAEDARRAEEEAKAPSGNNEPTEAGIVAAEEEAILPPSPQVDPTVKWVDEPMSLADDPGPTENPVGEWGDDNGPTRVEKPSDEEIIAALATHFRAPEHEVVVWLADMDISLALENHRALA